jgi:2-aminoethylphosphonate-pyruvate transaminase
MEHVEPPEAIRRPTRSTVIEKRTLFTPGPVMTSDRLKAVLAHPDMGQRRPAFEEIIDRVRTSLLDLFKADSQYAMAVVSGSGTAANETALSSIVKTPTRSC